MQFVNGDVQSHQLIALRVYSYLPLLARIEQRNMDSKEIKDDFLKFYEKRLHLGDLISSSDLQDILLFLERTEHLGQTIAEWNGNFYERLNVFDDEGKIIDNEDKRLAKLKDVANKRKILLLEYEK